MLNITAVSYLNTFPFVYGIRESGHLQNYRLKLEVPSGCAESLKTGSADIGLVPVGALPGLGDYRVITGYCIGAVRKVRTVVLLSTVPLEQITGIYLDFDSRTSVELVKVLSLNYWNISPVWIPLKAGDQISPSTHPSVVAIGDKTFRLTSQYPYVYDLAESWISFTGLPFVFAVWVSKQKPDAVIENQMNKALAFGVERKKEAVEYFKQQLPLCDNCLDYLENNISFELNDDKMQGMKKFLDYLR